VNVLEANAFAERWVDTVRLERSAYLRSKNVYGRSQPAVPR
jgi:hypothetical protein